MSWVAVGVAGASVAGAVISSSASSKASKRAAASDAEATDFAKQQYQDWQSVYGPIQDNLSSYYSNLSSDYYEATGLEAFNKEQQSAMEDVDASLAQRGLSNSGIATSIKSIADLTAASSRAKIRRDAPAQVAAQQQGFLQVGMGSDPTANMQNTLNTNSANAANTANSASAAAAKATGTAVSSLGSLIQTGLSSSNSGTTASSNFGATPATSSYSYQNWAG